MAEEKQYIAVDLGAESGRVMLGTVTEEKITLEDCHRFTNGPIEQNGALRWEFNRLITEIKTGIARAIKQSSCPVVGIAVDSWGVDFGLLDGEGKLIENPYHYRDRLTDGILEKAFRLMDKRDIYRHTGIQFMQINSVYQLLALRLKDAVALRRARSLVFIADLVGYYLCGEIFCEYSLASTSQMMDMQTGRWSEVIFKRFQLPLALMGKVVKPGTVVGPLKSELAAEMGCEPIPVIATGSHDTASAVAGVPVSNDDWAYLSSGTWSLMGLEIPEAIINHKTFEYQFTNEGGAADTIRLLQNIMGLWLVQECRREWGREGVELSYNELTEMAREARPFYGYINPDHHEFLSPGDMPGKINRYLAQTGQKTTEDKGRLIRLILESLAFRCRWVLDKLEDIKDHEVAVLHIVGGGIQNKLLCQFVANATGKKVIAGPVEATASGNVILQAMAAGQIKTLSQGRGLIRNSYQLEHYLPADKQLWDKEFQKINW